MHQEPPHNLANLHSRPHLLVHAPRNLFLPPPPTNPIHLRHHISLHLLALPVLHPVHVQRWRWLREPGREDRVCIYGDFGGVAFACLGLYP